MLEKEKILLQRGKQLDFWFGQYFFSLPWNSFYHSKHKWRQEIRNFFYFLQLLVSILELWEPEASCTINCLFTVIGDYWGGVSLNHRMIPCVRQSWMIPKWSWGSSLYWNDSMWSNTIERLFIFGSVFWQRPCELDAKRGTRNIWNSSRCMHPVRSSEMNCRFRNFPS